MAATSYSTLPSNSYVGYGARQDPYQSANYGTNDVGLGPLASHPYQYETSSFNVNPADKQQNSYTNKTQQHQPVEHDDHMNGSQAHLVRSEHQISSRHPKEQQQYKNQPPLQTNLTRSEQLMSKGHSTPPVQQRSLSNGPNNNSSDPSNKTSSFLLDLKPTKSSTMRAAAIKDKEKYRERKRQDQYFPSSENKPKASKSTHQRDSPKTDIEQARKEKPVRDKKKSHSVPQQHISHRDAHGGDDNESSGDDNNHGHHPSKSHKKTTFSDNHHDKNAHLPPIRRGRLPPHHDPYLDYPIPPGHPLRGRHPYDYYPPFGSYYGPYGNPHLHADPEDIPPYLAHYQDPYDPFFDYEKRKTKSKRPTDKHDSRGDHDERNAHANGYDTEPDDRSKSQLSRKSKNKLATHGETGRKSRRDNEENLQSRWPPGYYNSHFYHGQDMLEIWRQERNDYLKKKFKPSIHDVLYSQQFMKADGYLENQRRRVLRDAQGYYFPYKKYTLKDYKDIQKLNMQNPFSEVNEAIIDRKERAKKRQEYGTLVERQVVDNPGTRHIPPREMQPREPWHLSNSDIREFEKAATKRERAIEYSKVQVKYQPVDSTSDSHQYDSFERHTNNHASKQNNNQHPHHNQSSRFILFCIDYEHTRRNNQMYDDYDQ